MIPALLLAHFCLRPSIETGPAQPVPFSSVVIDDRYWSPRQRVNRAASVPHCLDMLDKAGNLRNFDLAAAGARTGFQGFVFNDSDVYKVIKGRPILSFYIPTRP